MKKQNILIGFILALFFSLGLHAQTTELVYSLGKASSTIHIASVATDASDNIFVCGSFTGTAVNFNPMVVGSDSNRTSAGSSDGFIAKYNSAGHLLKVIAFGATNADEGRKVYVDPATNNVYLLANIVNSAKFDNCGACFGSNGGSGAMVLVKYNNNLVLQVNRVLKTSAGAPGDLLNDIKVFGTDVYVTGLLNNAAVNFNPGGTAINLTPNGFTDIFIAKYNASLICQFAYNGGGVESDEGNSLDLDASGNIYLTGIFRGQDINLNPMGSTLVSEYGGGTVTNGDVFVAKYNPSMACQWAFNIGAASIDQGNSILVEKTGTPNIYVGGTVGSDVNSIDFDPSGASTPLYLGKGSNDLFVASYTSAGGYRWHLVTGSTGNDDLATMSFDSGGNIVFAGFASGNVNFGNSKTIPGLGLKDGYFAAASSTTGVATAAYNVGGGSDEQVNASTVSSSGRILLVGDLAGNGDYDPSGTTSTITKVGTQDGFITRYLLCTPPSISVQPQNATNCEGLGASFSVTASGATSYLWKKGGTPIPGATTSSYSITTLATTDAGSYTVDVTNACQTVPSSAATLVVNPKPVITSVLTGSVCSGTPQNYFITSTVAASYKWSRAGVAGITNTPVVNQTSNPITEILTNSFNIPIVVRYVITPTSTVGTCAGTAFNYDVTVNPKSTVTSAATGTICSAVAQNYVITSTVPSSYSWTRAAVAGITNAAGSGSTSPITEALVNNSASPIVVRYVIIPTANTGGCAGTAFNYDVTVNPTVVPSVTIATPSNMVCALASVTFTATPVNGGAAPTYQWNKGGTPIPGATSVTYTTTTVSTGDSYTVTMTSNAPCASPVTDISNAIVMTVNTLVTPAVTIAASPSNVICANTNVTFTATPSNGGATPTYLWSKNGSPISGATNATYLTTTTVVTGDSYTVTMTTNATCPTSPTATSTPIVMTVNSAVVPTVTAVVSPSATVCSGTSVTFTATANNGGLAPTYKWKLGTAYIGGATNATYTPVAVANGESYSVELTSNAACATPTVATTTPIVMTVNSTVVPTVAVTADKQSICPGTVINFTATPTNEGTLPTYVWNRNGNPISGATNATYSTATAVNNDSYTVIVTSSSGCASPKTVASSPILITVNPVLVPSVSITANGSTICTGTNVIFTAAPINGGTAPTYKWKKGGVIIPGATEVTYSTTTAANNDSYTVEMVSNAICASTVAVNSNAVVITITASPTPSVVITSNSGSPLCAGTSVTFTASPSNGGTPTYQWKKGVTAISGATNATYSTSAITNGDTYSVDMVSTLSCVTTANATSNILTMTVTPVTTSSVSIASSSITICAGTSITLTATPNAGSTPVYKWKLGSVDIPGATNASYTTTTATNGNSFTVEMTNTTACATPATVTSTPIVITVNPVVAASVAATVSNGSICAGTSITFTATPTGGGTPTYKWSRNGVPITGATNVTYVTTTAANNDSYVVEMTSSIICATPTLPVSTPIVMTVTPVTVPTIAATASTTVICPGTSVTFNSTQTGGGTPTYKWKLNGTVIPGATNDSYTTTPTVNGSSYSVEMSSTASCATPGTVTSSGIAITVNPTLVPTVSILASSNPICAGSSVNFTATPINGGTAPTYQWKKGGQDIPGATNLTYATTSAVDGDSYTVVLTSNALCASPLTVISNAVVMDVNPILTPTVSITANNSTICAGTSVTFTATAVNGGGAPAYKWKLGSTIIPSATNATYTTTGALNGESYTVEMTSSANCATTTPVTSNAVVITITTAPSATVSITSNPGTTICAGNTLTFTAVPGNGGTTPGYQWKLNSAPVSGATNVTYSSSSFATGDKVSVDMVSTSSCVVNPNASSTEATITVNPILTPSVAIATSTTTICAGTSVSFTATPVNGGTPLYQWKVGVTNVPGATNETFTSTTLANGNSVTVEMTSTAVCGLPATVPSNPIVMVVNPTVVPTISISASTTSICPGASITLTANATGAGATPTYKWKLAGTDIPGETSSTFVTTTAANNDSYTVELTSIATCATPAIVTSAPKVITVNVPTAITLQPINQSVCALGNAVTFSVNAAGSTLTYQWKRGTTTLSNNTTFAGVQTKNLTVSNVSNAELASYTVEITGSCGSVTSDPANLTLSSSPIVISTQPTPQSVATGGAISLSVVATGPSLTYQWKRNGAAISNDSRITGANTANLSITNAQVSDNFNDYTCVISSLCAATLNSASVNVTVGSTTAVYKAQAQGFKVSPNPSAGTFTLTNDLAPFEVEQIEIVSLNGVVVLTKKVSGGTHLDEVIEASELSSGMYMMIIKGEGQQALVKIAIDR